jgi:type I restriction enzyme, S subunit
MKQGWKKKTLKEVCEKITDGTHQTPKYFDDGIIFLSSKNVTSGKIDWDNIKYIDEKQHHEMHKRIAPKVNDILLAKNGTTGVAAMVDRDIVFDIYVSLAHIRVLDEILPNFMLYFINSPAAKKQFHKRLKGIGVPNLHLKEIREVEILYPKSLPEQKHIVAILDKAFAAIAKAKDNAEQNLENAKELFESYLQGVFENKGEDWEEKCLGVVCAVERGSSPRPIKKYFTDRPDGVNWIKIGDTKEVDKYIYTTKQKITKDGALQSRFVDIDDFILSNSMSFGKPYIMKTQGYIHDGWFVLRLPKNIDTEFLWYLLSSSYTMNQFVSLAAGAVVKNISGDLVKKTVLPIPPLKTQQSIVNKLDALSAETKKLETLYQQKTEDLEELKKSVLQKAFNGELT